jgi:3-deoxy-manno-octulosonate cytidylyltransferase (CMP-KDO synthetase)
VSSGPTPPHTIPAAVVVIPARYASTRLPGKPLADIGGKTMIEHVYRRASAARGISTVLVATDDARIAAAVEAFGGQAVLTRPDHPTGTDRIAEVARALQAELIVNVQGDEPWLDPAAIESALAPLQADASIVMGTLGHALDEAADPQNPHIVKVVVDQAGFALYFSRAPLPYRRSVVSPGPAVLRHVGLYVYRREFLLHLASLAPTPLERAESLEQLRALEYGYRIRVVPTTLASLSVDTPEDLERARRLAAATAVR